MPDAVTAVEHSSLHRQHTAAALPAASSHEHSPQTHDTQLPLTCHGMRNAIASPADTFVEVQTPVDSVADAGGEVRCAVDTMPKGDPCTPSHTSRCAMGPKGVSTAAPNNSEGSMTPAIGSLPSEADAASTPGTTAGGCAPPSPSAQHPTSDKESANDRLHSDKKRTRERNRLNKVRKLRKQQQQHQRQKELSDATNVLSPATQLQAVSTTVCDGETATQHAVQTTAVVQPPTNTATSAKKCQPKKVVALHPGCTWQPSWLRKP